MPESDVWIIALLGALAGSMTVEDAIVAAHVSARTYGVKYLRAGKSPKGKVKN